MKINRQILILAQVPFTPGPLSVASTLLSRVPELLIVLFYHTPPFFFFFWSTLLPVFECPLKHVHRSSFIQLAVWVFSPSQSLCCRDHITSFSFSNYLLCSVPQWWAVLPSQVELSVRMSVFHCVWPLWRTGHVFSSALLPASERRSLTTPSKMGHPTSDKAHCQTIASCSVFSRALITIFKYLSHCYCFF